MDTTHHAAATIRDEQAAWARHELDRERSQTRLFIVLAIVLVPAWIPVDHLLEPQVAGDILVLRLAHVAVGLVLLWGARSARTVRQLYTLAVLNLISTGVAIALMLPLIHEHYWPYVLGFSLLFWGTAVVSTLPVVAVGAGSGVVLAVATLAMALRPERRDFAELVGGAFFIVSAVIICLAQVAHRRRLERQAFRSAQQLTEASRKVLESEELKAQFFSNVSHELRTPLTLILGPAEQLLAAPGLSDEQRRSVELVLRNARMLLGHVNDLLDVSRLVAKEVTLRPTSTDLGRLLEDVAAQFESLAAERDITYVVAAEPLPAEVDREKIHRVLLNLLSNAFKVTPRGGKIRCTLRVLEGGRALLEVADSGPGIPPEHRELVFERFRQVEGGQTRELGGTGLGLAIAKDFVELHEGTLSVGDAEEGGAVLRVELPLRRATPALPAADADAQLSRDELTRHALAALQTREQASPDDEGGDEPLVLVVEDNLELNRFVRESLAPDFRTASATDGREGLQKALALAPDLVITDLMMPKMSGDQLVEAIREHERLDDVPILIVSAKADEPLRVRLLREGAQDYVTKPFSAEELRARATNLVSVRRARVVLQAELDLKGQSLERLAREVTRQKRELKTALDSMAIAREQAEQASELKTSFLRLVSHELRSPLTALMLQLHRIERPVGEPLPADKQALVQRMARSATRLRDLIEGLLEYARIQSGKLTTEIERFDVVELAREALLDVTPQAQDKQLTLTLKEPGELPWLSSDPRIVRLVLVNLLSNAIKFTAAGQVTLVLGCEEGRHWFAVRDTGPGIPVEDRPRLFEPFEQLEPSRGKHLVGVGLGLALVREMVGALGGTVEVESELGVGSTFTVRLPQVAADEPTAKDTHVGHSAAG